MQLRHQRDTNLGDPLAEEWKVYGPHGVLAYRRFVGPLPSGMDPGDNDYLLMHRVTCWFGCGVGDASDDCLGQGGCRVLLGEAACHSGFHPALDVTAWTLHDLDEDVLWRCLDETYRAVMPDPNNLTRPAA